VRDKGKVGTASEFREYGGDGKDAHEDGDCCGQVRVRMSLRYNGSMYVVHLQTVGGSGGNTLQR
jgi:hypothetical protein